MSIDGIGVGIVGIGVFLPSHVRTNDYWGSDFFESFDQKVSTGITTAVDERVQTGRDGVDPSVVAATIPLSDDPFRGTVERRVADPKMLPSDLAAAAGTAALESAGLTPENVDCVINHSVLTDLASPRNHGVVAHKIGLNRAVCSFTLDAGCGSFLPQLSTACRLVQSGEYTTILCIVTSVISRVTDYTSPSSVNPGDGAVAVVIKRIASNKGYIAQAQCTRGDLHRGIELASPDHKSTDWHKSHGQMYVRPADRQAVAVMSMRASSLCNEACERVLQKAGYTVADVDFFICSQATGWFSTAIAEGLGIDPSKRLHLPDHFERFGHLMAASAPLNLYLAQQAGRLKSGDLVLLYSPGAGFTYGAILYRWNQPLALADA